LNFLNFLNFHQPKLLPWNCNPIPLLLRHENKSKTWFPAIFRYFQILSNIFRYFQIFSNIFH
jgi:hypothetical protein